MRIVLRILLGAVAVALLSSCASSVTYKQQFVGIEEKLRAHDYATAITQIEASKTICYKQKDQILYYLDVGC